MMTRVLVVEEDTTLRETLREGLHEEGYTSVGIGDIDLALAALQISPYPLVVLVGYDGATGAHAHSLIEAAGALPPHAYLLLSACPDQAPAVRNPHTGRLVPIVAAPCDTATLGAQVDEASNRLAGSQLEVAEGWR